jgi:hypothetical protein
MQWWEALTSFQQVMFVLATAATVVMIIFLVLMLFGGDGEGFEADGDISLDDQVDDIDPLNDEPLSEFSGLRILTVRGVLAFLSVGAWTAYGFAGIVHPLLAGLFGVIAGIIASYLLAYAFRASMKLESEGNLSYINAVGKNGTVYIRVPAKRQGMGKVTLTFQERFVEVDAMTDDDSDLTTGMSITVISMENETTVIVTKNNNNK